MMRGLVLSGALLLTAACGEERTWQVTASGLDEALMSISGSSEKDVWAVGGDTGKGPLVLHFDGTTWERKVTGTSGALWWVHTLKDGTAFLGGTRGIILEWDGSSFIRHATPALARQTVFGVWASARDDVYAVGAGTSGRRGFLWHYDGTDWSEIALPVDVPLKGGETPGLFKVWGLNADDVYAVGADGLVLHKDATGWKRIAVDRTDTIFTVSGNAKRLYLSGGGLQGELLESNGDAFKDVSPTDVALVQGVAADQSDSDRAFASGEGGAIFERSNGAWKKVDHGLTLDVESLHATWIDHKGRVWAVGGKVLTNLTGGAIVQLAPKGQPSYVQPTPPTPPEVVCPAAQIDPAPSKSIARRWNEQILGAIRRDLPRPTVHARNLFHLSSAMWDAWAAYDATAKGVFVTEKATASDLDAARTEAISYAAYRVLEHRYANANGGPISKACFRAFVSKLGYDPDDQIATGDSPRALGNRIAAAIIEHGKTDGANEQNNYADTTGFMASNPPLPVENPSNPVDDIDHWQPLDLAIAATQNGIPLAPGVQKYIGAQWGHVTPFAMERVAGRETYMDPGETPTITPAHMSWVVEMIQKAHDLEPSSTQTIDVSPGAYGNNPLGSNDGHGHPLNPSTGQPYASQIVPLGDFGRVMAEFWADGPKSETPPGHWNVMANRAFDHPSFVRRWRGEGEVLSELQFDVRAYLAMNGALHDAAIAAWEIKRVYLCSRPITQIRTCAARGQSSDASKPAYDPRGLPLIDGLIEIITDESSRPGQRHEQLRAAIGQIAINTWRGEAGDVHRLSGNGWLRGVEWVPYQKRDFVTPAFPGFISGHSTFSRAAAETLTRLTGSAFFPGGILEQVINANSTLTFESGPSQTFTLQWGTYFDAADQAGQSRLWGGIHIQPDDFQGRRVGAQVGDLAFDKAESYF